MPQQETSTEPSGVRFSRPLDPELFNEVARDKAKKIAKEKNTNKPTQLRRFYDELALWETRVNQSQDKFSEFLPLIKMINAKVAYAKGRKLVDDHYAKLMYETIKEVKNPETLTTCKLFWEAFMGFYKQERPSD